MRSITTTFLVAAASIFPACQSDPAQHNAERAATAGSAVIEHTIAFKHQDARIAANYARAEFGQPPMDGVVQVTCDGKANSWIVKAIPADMARVEKIAARFDQPGEAPWKKAP